jgi:dCMP deaminase
MSSERTELKHFVFMRIAWELSVLGTCDRKKVGAVIVKDGRCITWGFNGAPPGVLHCEENYHGWSWVSMYTEREALLKENGCRNATHAEANALAFAARQGISTDAGTLYVTCAPCDTCSRLIIAAGIEKVFYAEEYRDPAGVELLRKALVEAVHVKA